MTQDDKQLNEFELRVLLAGNSDIVASWIEAERLWATGDGPKGQRPQAHSFWRKAHDKVDELTNGGWAEAALMDKVCGVKHYD